MLASEFIREMRRMIEDHGDREVVNEESDYVTIEFDSGDAGNEPAFVVG